MMIYNNNISVEKHGKKNQLLPKDCYFVLIQSFLGLIQDFALIKAALKAKF